jgi:hypothetical protein
MKVIITQEFELDDSKFFNEDYKNYLDEVTDGMHDEKVPMSKAERLKMMIEDGYVASDEFPAIGLWPKGYNVEVKE